MLHIRRTLILDHDRGAVGAIGYTLHPPPHTPLPLSMTTNNGRLGVCPNCGHEIRTGDELITYERSNSTTGVFAECPSCRAVVNPE